MKCIALFILISLPTFAKIEVCQRPAKIAFGLVNHYWLKTDTITAGMGSARAYNAYIGDQMEAPFTSVYVVDHSDQPAKKCKDKSTANYDEECINHELQVGKPLGKFTPINHCLAFVRRTLRKCETQEYKLFKKEKSEYYRLRHEDARGNLTYREEQRMHELEEKYKF